MKFTKDIPEHWEPWCARNADLFNTPEWHTVLSEGFHCQTLYGSDEDETHGVTITIFPMGPFRVGYLGFPAGGTVDGRPLSQDVIARLRESPFPARLHCIRVPVSAFDSHHDLALGAQVNQETVIENLQEWGPEQESGLRQRVNKALRSPLEVQDVSDESQGEALFALYRDTVYRHGGSLKYTAAYFRALIELAKSQGKLRCLLAVMDDQLAGFEVVACHRQTGYSLHGCTDPGMKRFSTSDLLTYSAIAWAKKQGMSRYSLMASPVGQTSLVRYKERWGGVTREQKTYELALKPIQAAMFKKMSSLYHKMPAFMKMTWRR